LLPARWSDLWDVFKTVANKGDMEALEQFLADEAIRHEFYARLALYGKCLHISLSSDKLEDVVDKSQVHRYVTDLKRFSELRRAVRVRYQEAIDLRDYEPRIRKLLDDHVTAMPAEVVIEAVNINEPDSLRSVIEDPEVSAASKADRIASATRRVITERMEEDPALFRQFSQMLQDTIDDYRARRIAEREYLQQILDIAGQVSGRERDTPLPELILHNDDAAALYGAFEGLFVKSEDGGLPIGEDERAQIAVDVLAIVRNHLIVGIWVNEPAQNDLLNALDDYCWDELEAKRNIELPPELTDELQQRILSIAKARFPR
jgi:type I restriction enzyme R subunit